MTRPPNCDCAHKKSDHFEGGMCKACACTWYYPNIRWIKRQHLYDGKVVRVPDPLSKPQDESE